MSVVLLILVAWGVLDAAFVGALSLISLRSARRRAARGERVLRTLRVGETSVPSPHS